MRKIVAIAVIMLSIVPSSVLCAFGPIDQKANYANAWPTVEYETDITIAVGAHDQRPYIINGEKSPTYVGTARTRLALSGIPFNVNTVSNKPLSDDIASAIVSGFKGMGAQAQSIPIVFSDSHQAALGKLKQLWKRRIVLITLREWRSDTYRYTGFFIDAQLQVYDEEGKEIASSSTSHKNIGTGDGTVEFPEVAAGLHLSNLLNDPKVKAVLSYKLTDKEKLVDINKNPTIVKPIETGKDGRFIAYNNGTVIDTRTGLMWADMDNRSGVKWHDAKKYCENYRWGGYKDWRMPTQEELAGLYDNTKRGKLRFITSLIRLTDTWVWSSETRSSEAAGFGFDGAERFWDLQSSNYGFYRALPVRTNK